MNRPAGTRPLDDPAGRISGPGAGGSLVLLMHYGRELALTLDLARIYELTVDAAIALSDVPAALLCSRLPDSLTWQPILGRGLGDDLAAALCRATEAEITGALPEPLPAFGTESGDLAPWRGLPTFAQVPGLAGIASRYHLEQMLTLPLALAHEGSFLLHLLAPTGASIPHGNLGALKMLLDQAGVAMRNSQFYSQTARWANRLAMLQSAGTEINATLDLGEVLSAAIRWAVDLVEGATGVLALWSTQTRLLRVETSSRGNGLLDNGQRTATLGEGLAGRVAQTRRMLALADYAQWEYALSPLPSPALHALVAIPLLWQDDLLGVLEVSDQRTDRAFTDEDISLLMLLSQQTASAIANARLYERAQQRLHQLTVLQDTSRTIISQLDYDQVLRTVLRNASNLLNTTMGAVFVPDEKQDLIGVRTAVGLNETHVREMRVVRGEGPVGRAITSARPQAVYDLRTDPPAAPEIAPGVPEYRSILAVPLISQGQALGALCVYSATPRHWSPAEAELLLVFASQAANAMQNALLFERLRAEKATLATTIQSMSDGLVLTDAGGAIILANRVADRLFNVPFTASIGMNLLAVLESSPYPREYRAGDPPIDLLDTVLGQGMAFRGELDIRRPEHITLEFSFLPVIGAGYIITGGLAVFHDITELRRLNELKSDFISTVSHELRTPLTSIKGFVKLVLVESLGPLTTQQRECLTVADREADRLTHLINDVLDISRIEAGRMTFTWEVLQPTDLVTGVIQALQPQAAELGLHLEAVLPTGLPLIRGDRQRITQILTNLLGNAIKFTPADGRIGVAAHADNDLLVVRVADTGIGIPESALPYIFDRFYQADNGSRRTRGGTGLGLAITKQLVELHGGSITVTSSPGEGAAFTFTLPVATEEDRLSLPTGAP